jgi:hypothetical protein
MAPVISALIDLYPLHLNFVGAVSDREFGLRNHNLLRCDVAIGVGDVSHTRIEVQSLEP